MNETMQVCLARMAAAGAAFGAAPLWGLVAASYDGDMSTGGARWDAHYFRLRSIRCGCAL